MDEARYDAQTLKAKLKRWSKEASHYKAYALCENLIAERDRLAAENAELKWKAKESELAMMEAQQNEDFANATLDALREAVPDGSKWCADCEKMTVPDSEYFDCCSECGGEDYWTFGPASVHAILYPQPKETTDDER